MLDQLYERTQLPCPENKIEIFTDGNTDYKYVLPKLYAETCMNYGQLVKIKKGGRLVDKEKRITYGDPEPDEIETTNIENFNGVCRERIGRLVRKTKCFSKHKDYLENALHLFQFYWNFINEFKRGTSPAIMEGLTEHLWTWHDFFYFPLTILD